MCTSTGPNIYEMVDAGGPGSVRKCPGTALTDLGDVEGFNRGGEEGHLYFSSCLMGSTKEKSSLPLSR